MVSGEDVLRMSPDAKAERRISNQSLAVLFEETEDTYETLSSKYDDVTFSDVKNDVRGSVPDVSKMVSADEPDFVHAVVETAPAKVECEVMPSHVRECVKSTKTAPITSPDVPTSAVATPAQSTLTSTQAVLTIPAQSHQSHLFTYSILNQQLLKPKLSMISQSQFNMPRRRCQSE